MIVLAIKHHVNIQVKVSVQISMKKNAQNIFGTFYADKPKVRTTGYTARYLIDIQADRNLCTKMDEKRTYKTGQQRVLCASTVSKKQSIYLSQVLSDFSDFYFII